MFQEARLSQSPGPGSMKINQLELAYAHPGPALFCWVLPTPHSGYADSSDGRWIGSCWLASCSAGVGRRTSELRRGWLTIVLNRTPRRLTWSVGAAGSLRKGVESTRSSGRARPRPGTTTIRRTGSCCMHRNSFRSGMPSCATRASEWSPTMSFDESEEEIIHLLSATVPGPGGGADHAASSPNGRPPRRTPSSTARRGVRPLRSATKIGHRFDQFLPSMYG